MTTINDIRAAVYARIATLALPTDWGDANQGDTPDTTGIWIRPSVRFNVGGQQSLGGQNVATRRLRGGTVTVQVFSPLLTGEEPGDAAANQLLLLFEGQRDGPVFYRDVTVRDVGRNDSHWQQNVTASFEADVVCL